MKRLVCTWYAHTATFFGIHFLGKIINSQMQGNVMTDKSYVG